MAISSVSSMNNSFRNMSINNMYRNKTDSTQEIASAYKNVEKQSEKLASGKRINRSSDDPAGAAIAQKILSMSKGLRVGSGNVEDMSSAMKVADGAMSSVQEGLGRMKELSLQASNATMTAEDKKNIQMEIDQIKGFIDQTAKNTEFNTKPLLDGSFKDMNVASGASGEGNKVSIGDMTLEGLGIKDFDVTGSFSLDALNGAMGQVSENRGNVGATSNRLEAQFNNNENAYVNSVKSYSTLTDADMAETAMNYRTQQALAQYGMFTQSQMQFQQLQMVNLLS